MSRHREREYFLFENPEMKKILRRLRQQASLGRPCLLVGETGCGKDFLAWIYFLALLRSEIFKERLFKATIYEEAIRRERNKNNPLTPRYKELDRLLRSLRIGEFYAVNCASFVGKTARKEIFGFARGSFKNALENKPGLLEILLASLFFMDEIGQLDPQIQIMLNYALAHPFEGHRVGNLSTTYSTRHLFFIGATEFNNLSELRDSFRGRFEIILEIPNLDQRPEDIPVAIRFFLREELIELTDEFYIVRLIGLNVAVEKDTMRKDRQLLNFVESIACQMDNEAQKRSWNENFRSLGALIANAVQMADDYTSDINYINNVVGIFYAFLDQYSQPKNPNNSTSFGRITHSSIPNNDKTLTEHVFNLLEGSQIGKNAKERKILAEFLVSYGNGSFIRADLDEYLRNFKNNSKASSLNIINKLKKSGIIEMKGKGKSIRYEVIITAPVINASNSSPVLLPLPRDHVEQKQRIHEADYVVNLSGHNDCQFLYGSSGSGKTNFLQMVGRRLQKDHIVHWYPMGTGGMQLFFIELIEFLCANYYIACRDYHGYTCEELYIIIMDHFQHLFAIEKRPFLLIDNTQVLNDYENKEWIMRILKEWTDIRFILTGIKLDSDIEPATGRHFRQYKVKMYKK